MWRVGSLRECSAWPAAAADQLAPPAVSALPRPALPPGAVYGPHQPADAAAHQGPQVRRRNPLWRDGARLAAGPRRGLPAARPVRWASGRTRRGGFAWVGACEGPPLLAWQLQRLGPPTLTLLSGPLPSPCSLHSCSDYHVMDVCANCGLLISTLNVPQAAAGACSLQLPAGGRPSSKLQVHTRAALSPASPPACHPLQTWRACAPPAARRAGAAPPSAGCATRVRAACLIACCCRLDAGAQALLPRCAPMPSYAALANCCPPLLNLHPCLHPTPARQVLRARGAALCVQIPGQRAGGHEHPLLTGHQVRSAQAAAVAAAAAAAQATRQHAPQQQAPPPPEEEAAGASAAACGAAAAAWRSCTHPESRQ